MYFFHSISTLIQTQFCSVSIHLWMLMCLCVTVSSLFCQICSIQFCVCVFSFSLSFCMWLTVESLSQFRSVDRILKLFSRVLFAFYFYRMELVFLVFSPSLSSLSLPLSSRLSGFVLPSISSSSSSFSFHFQLWAGESFCASLYSRLK